MTTETEGVSCRAPWPEWSSLPRSATPDGIQQPAASGFDSDPPQRLATLVLEHGPDLELAAAAALGHQLQPEAGAGGLGHVREALRHVGTLDRHRRAAGDRALGADLDFGSRDLAPQHPADDLDLPPVPLANPEVTSHALTRVGSDVDDLYPVASHAPIVRKQGAPGLGAGLAGLDAEALLRAVVELDDSAERARGALEGAGLDPLEACPREQLFCEVEGEERARVAEPERMRQEARADAPRLVSRHLEIAGVAGAVGVDGAVEVGQHQAQRAFRLEHAQQLGQRRDQLRVGELRQRVDADHAVDGIRVERQAATDVGDEIDAGLLLAVGVDPAPGEVRTAAPVETGQLRLRQVFRLRCLLHAHSTPSLSSRPVRTLRESRCSSAIALAAAACSRGFARTSSAASAAPSRSSKANSPRPVGSALLKPVSW